MSIPPPSVPLDTKEFYELTKKFNSAIRKIITKLTQFNGNDLVMKRLQRLSNIYIEEFPNDLLLTGGPMLFIYKEDILNNSVQKLLDEDYSKYIFSSVDNDGKKFIIDIINIIKNSWLSMKDDEQNYIRREIKNLLNIYVDYYIMVFN